MRKAKLRDIMRKYIFASYENEPNKNKIGITKIKVDISKINVGNYMDYLQKCINGENETAFHRQSFVI